MIQSDIYITCFVIIAFYGCFLISVVYNNFVTMNYKQLGVLCALFLVMVVLTVSCNGAAQETTTTWVTTTQVTTTTPEITVEPEITLEVEAAPAVPLGENAPVRVTIKNMPGNYNVIEMTWYGFTPPDLPRQMTIEIPPLASSPGTVKAFQLIWESSNPGILGTDARMPSLPVISPLVNNPGKINIDLEHYLQTLSVGSTEITFTLKDGDKILDTEKVVITVTEGEGTIPSRNR